MRPYLVDWLAGLIGRDAALLLAPTWFACIGLTWLVVGVWVMRSAQRRGEHVPTVAVALAAVYAAALIAGIALPALLATGEALVRGEGLHLRWAGMTSYAGYAGGALVLLLVLRKSGQIAPARFADLLAAPMALGLAIGRLGCFLAGCDYGQVTSVGWAVRFPAGSPAWRAQVAAGWLPRTRGESLPVHPTQLYEALLGLALCGLALCVARSAWGRRRDGRAFAVVVAGYALGRIAIENLRGDLGRGVYGPWSAAQIVFALLLVAMAFAAVRHRRSLTGALGSAVLVLALAGRAHAEPEDASAQTSSQRSLRVSGFLAAGAPLNRRDRQVPPMAGASVTAGLDLGSIALALDLSSMASSVAAHQSAALVFGATHELSSTLSAGGRVGLGMTLVNFEDPAFSDVVTADLRLGSEIEYAVTQHWAVTMRPIELDFIDARVLGGPIVSYQFQIGLTFRGRGRHESPAATQPVPAYPPNPYPPGPYTNPPPNPYPPNPYPAPPPPAPAPPPT